MALSDDDKAHIKAVIDEARHILRDDRILARLPAPEPGEPDDQPEEPGGPPKAPPRKTTPPDPQPKRDKWWGDAAGE
jgi:hypothetical protein